MSTSSDLRDFMTYISDGAEGTVCQRGGCGLAGHDGEIR